MRDRAAVALYLAALLLFTSVHDLRWLVGGLGVWSVLAGRDSVRLLRRALVAILVFNLTVSAGVVLVGLLGERIDGAWLLRANLRVLLLTACTLLLASRVDAAQVLAPWPALATVVQLVRAQMRGMRRLLDDFRLGLRSRSLRRPQPRVLAQHGAATGSFFLGKALHDAEEISLALRARGAWRDVDGR